MSFWGMDTEQVLSGADALEHAAGRLDEILDQLHGVTMAAPWEGPDADAFRDSWLQVRAQGDSLVVPDVRARARMMSDHAAEQDRASDVGGGFWDSVADFFQDAGEPVATLVDTVATGADRLGEQISDGFSGLFSAGTQMWNGLTDYASTLLGNVAETSKTPYGMVHNLLTTGSWPSLTELVVGTIDHRLDTLNTTVHAVTGHDMNLADDGSGYADAPQRVHPGQDGAPDLNDPRTVADLIHNTNALYGDEETGEVGMTVVRDESGDVTGVVATIPGTELWGPIAGDNPLDLTGNAALAGPHGRSAGSQATADAVTQLYERHDIPPGTPLMLSGHSQGGMIASSLAADPDFASRHNLTNVMSYGAPVDNYDVSPGVDYLHLQHLGDPVPLIDLEGFPHGTGHHPNVETVTMPGPHLGLSVDNHGGPGYYDSVEGSAVEAHQGDMAPFLVGPDGSADHYSSDVHRNN